MIYKDYRRNHVLLPGRGPALEAFLKQDYKGMRHKWNNGFSSHSEDALTWSCFDILSNMPLSEKIKALSEIFEDAYQEKSNCAFNIAALKENEVQIHIGKQYTGLTSKESTEVDASVELPDKLIFFEAKLYSTVSLASPPEKPHDQIARKLRIGLDKPLNDNREFYFIFLDIAPLEILTKRKSKSEALATSKKGFDDKWKSAWLFNYYKFGRNNSLSPLKKALEGINVRSFKSVADNMGWLTWGDLFKIVLRSIVVTNR
jgi:hypothetical protein